MQSRLHAHIGTFRQLEILLAVYEGGSIKAASEQLFLTQPTISIQLRKLADAIGLPLYQQVGKRLKFTDAGIATANTARVILNNCKELDIQLSNLRELKTGTLSIACVTTAKYCIPHLLGPFCQKYPGIDVQFTIANRRQIIERLECSMDDFYVFSHLPNELDIESIEFMPNNLVAIADKHHRLTKQKPVTLAEFCNENYLQREVGSGTRHATDELFKEHHLTPNVKMTIASNEAIIHSVLSKLGVSILSEHSLSFREKDSISIIDVEGLPLQSQWSFAWQKNHTLSLIAREFLKYVEQEGKTVMMENIC